MIFSAFAIFPLKGLKRIGFENAKIAKTAKVDLGLYLCALGELGGKMVRDSLFEPQRTQRTQSREMLPLRKPSGFLRSWC